MRNMFPVGTKAARTWREQILANLHWPMCQVLHHNVNVSDFMLDVLNICSVEYVYSLPSLF